MTRETPNPEGFARFLKAYHRLAPDQVVPTESPGYWRLLVPCGREEHRCCPGWGTASTRPPYFHTINYTDGWKDDKTGRFVSIYRTWLAAREATQ